uniref:Putative secreted protein of the basic tail family n=1 Tax=Hyalomma excavatum TaxID=257692 RepID=A0A131XNI9_9ACAR
MLVLALCSLLVYSVHGTEFLDLKGKCPGPEPNPGKPVQSCDYYCRKNDTYVKGYFESGTGCEYAGEVGTCLEVDGETSCHSPEDPLVEKWNTKETSTARPPAVKPPKQKPKPTGKNKTTATKPPKTKPTKSKNTKGTKKTKKVKSTKLTKNPATTVQIEW